MRSLHARHTPCAELVYFDARGCGRSSRPECWEELNHARWVDDVERLRQELGCARVVVFGHSYGGILALEYALRYPEHLDGLVLCSTNAVYDFPEVALGMVAAHTTQEQYAQFLSALSGPVSDDATFAEIYPRIVPAYFHAWNAKLATDTLAGVTYSAGALNRSMFHELARYDVSGRLGEIQVPTLVISGGDDFFSPREEGIRRLGDGIASSEIVVLDACGHFPFSEQPDAFLAAVTDWLQRL